MPSAASSTNCSSSSGENLSSASALAQLASGKAGEASEAGAAGEAGSALLLDEPTAALDLGYQLEIAALLVSLNQQRGLTMLISTHDLAFASSVCHELVLLRAGRVIASGAVDDVLTAATVRALYDVEADVHRDAASGRVMVLPRRHIRP